MKAEDRDSVSPDPVTQCPSVTQSDPARLEKRSPGELAQSFATLSVIFCKPKRRRLQDLERRVNDLGNEFFVETTNPQTGKPVIWYRVDNKSNVHCHVRDD